MNATDVILEMVEGEIVSGNPAKALELLDKHILIEGVSAAGLSCRCARAMGYGNGLFNAEDATERCIEDYRFVRLHGMGLIGDASRVYVEALWSLGPDKHYDELRSVLTDWSEKGDDSIVANFRLAVLYEFYGGDYGKAQAYYKKVFKRRVWLAGESWARCLVKEGKPLRGVVVYVVSILCKPFFHDHVQANAGAV